VEKRVNKNLNRLCIFAHYDKDNLVDEYVLYYLQKVKEISTSVIFVSTSKINEDGISKLGILCDKVILRENQGYDFMSWQKGIELITNLSNYDELILCNDSVYGPLYSLSDIFDVMRSKGGDFWGITDSFEISYHLQSYFLVFKKRVIISDAFRNFWSRVKIESRKNDIIKKYEVGLTQYLISKGFKPGAFLASSSFTFKILRSKIIFVLKHPLTSIKIIIFAFQRYVLNYKALNSPQYLWKDLFVNHHMPFIKIELLRDNPARVNVEGYEKIIEQNSNYNIILIKRHLERIKREQGHG
jgi:lipopolysaccharide biosynthesis protein